MNDTIVKTKEYKDNQVKAELYDELMTTLENNPDASILITNKQAFLASWRSEFKLRRDEL